MMELGADSIGITRPGSNSVLGKAFRKKRNGLERPLQEPEPSLEASSHLNLLQMPENGSKAAL